MAEEEDGAGSAAEAFETLRQEVAQARRDLGQLSRQVQAQVPADYSPTLGEMAKTLEALRQRLAAIEAKPALGVTAETWQRQIREAGQLAASEAASVVRAAAQRQSDVLLALEATVDRAQSAREERGWRWAISGLSLVAGMGLYMLLVAVLPGGGGSWLAALPLRQDESWRTGEILMKAAAPEEFDRIVKLSLACQGQAVDACTTAMALGFKVARLESQSAPTEAPPAPARPQRRRGG
jgi:hypothetical protein